MSPESDNFDPLRSNQRRAVESIAAGRTLEQAAIEAGVTVRTVYRWRSEPGFQAAIRTVNEQALDHATMTLASAAVVAVETLRDLLTSDTTKDAVKVAACRAILDNVLKIKELHDFDKRLGDIERALHDQQRQSQTA